jgi:hypothetical protein
MMTAAQHKQVLGEVVKTFGQKQWFRDATVWDAYPTDGAPTLEFKVNYLPIFERKEVKEFLLRFNLAERFTVVDRNGKPVE